MMTMYFGKMDDTTVDYLFRCSTAYRNLIEKSSRYVSNRLTMEFVDRSINTCSVLIDDSEKFGHAATVVMFICLMKDKSIQSRIASLLTAATKKAEGAFRELYTFLLDTFGWEQLLLITSGTTDGFGAACVTMGLLLKAIDALCSMHPHVVKTIVADNGVEFFLSEAVRQERARKCFMHAWDRVFNNFFEALLQKKGLGDDGSTSQNIYSIHYWEKKFKPKFDALIMESVDMNSANAAVERKKLEACSKLLDEIRESRWLSRENVCLQLVGAMNVAATQLFQDKVKAYFDYLLEIVNKMTISTSKIYLKVYGIHWETTWKKADFVDAVMLHSTIVPKEGVEYE
jgi:hypothetical protein